MSHPPSTQPVPPGQPIVVFDLGGVMVRICRSWEEACAAAGEPYYPQVRDPAMLEARKAVVRQHEIGALPCESFFVELAATTFGLYSPEQVRRIHTAWLLGEYPGIGDVVDELHRAGIPTGVLSNTNHAHWVAMMPRRWHTAAPQGATDPADRHPASGYPTLARILHPHASHLLGHTKPTVEIHRAFEHRVGVRPEQVLFFDDLADNVTGARVAGWKVHQIDHTADTAAQMRATLRQSGLLSE
jgi:glucose-1-phosphatase